MTIWVSRYILFLNSKLHIRLLPARYIILMAKLIFKLRDVPLDEAQDVRELLSENDISFYETNAGNWGIGMAGIWLNDDLQYQSAITLLDTYEQQRSQGFNDEYAELEHTGRAPTLLSNLRDSPLRFVVYIFSIVVILYISVMPFINI